MTYQENSSHFSHSLHFLSSKPNLKLQWGCTEGNAIVCGIRNINHNTGTIIFLTNKVKGTKAQKN